MRAGSQAELREYPVLTGLRGFAALWVLVYHAWVEAEPRLMLLPLGFTTLDLTPAFSLGWFGVDVFFSLSAFLLALPFAHAAVQQHQGPRWRDYFRRRVLRILPAYYLQLALVLLFIGWNEQRVGLDLRGLAAHAFLWLNLGQQPVAPLVGVWWTLPIEFGFYLLLPMLAPMLTLRRVGWLVAAAVGLTLAYRLGMFHYAADRSIGQKVLLLEQLPGRLDQFVIGTAAAVWIANQPELGRALPAARARALLLIGLALLFGLFLQMHWKSMQYWEGHWLLFSFHGLASIGIAACMIAACSERIADLRLLATRPLVFLGSVSYSLYLWHQLIIQWLGKQPWVEQASPYTLPVLLLAGGGPALLVAWVSWRLIEQPCLAWGRSALPVGAGQGGGHARRGTDR